ncbi:MAG: hypothetical protein JNJ92_01625 [Altererythrobacter sp.]|nr:hypothetical protein [Altererythrobacter sp.]
MAKKARYLFSRDKVSRVTPEENKSLKAKVFRSDNGRRQFLMESAVVVSLTIPAIRLVDDFGIPSQYSAAAIIPGLMFFALSRFVTWLNRKRGKRFSSYDYDDFDGD